MSIDGNKIPTEVARARYYQYMNEDSSTESRASNVLKSSITLEQFIAALVFVAGTGGGAIINSYSTIWQMQRDIEDAKLGGRTLTQEIKDIKDGLGEAEKTLTEYQHQIERKFLVAQGEINQIVGSASDKHLKINELSSSIRTQQAKIGQLGDRVRHIEIVTGVYDKGGRGGGGGK